MKNLSCKQLFEKVRKILLRKGIIGSVKVAEDRWFFDHDNSLQIGYSVSVFKADNLILNKDFKSQSDLINAVNDLE